MRVPEWAVEYVILYPNILSAIQKLLRKNENKKGGYFRQSSLILKIILDKLPADSSGFCHAKSLESMAGRKVIWVATACQKEVRRLTKLNQNKKIKIQKMRNQIHRLRVSSRKMKSKQNK